MGPYNCYIGHFYQHIPLHFFLHLYIDLECEEEEVASQSDSLTGQAASRPGQAASVSGRKRMYSETTLEQFSPTSSDTKCRQASDLHNERERER